MTAINRLINIPLISDDDLFVIWEEDSGRTRSITGENVRKCLLAKGFNPDAFVSGYVKNGHLFLTNQKGALIDIGLVDLPHKIQDLVNVPPLEAKKFLKVSDDGTEITYQTGSTESEIGIENKGQALGIAHSLDIDGILKVSLDNNKAKIWFDGFEIANQTGNLGTVNRFFFSPGFSIVVDNQSARIALDLSTHEIQELGNVPPLQANKFLVGNSAGNALVFSDFKPDDYVSLSKKEDIAGEKTFLKPLSIKGELLTLELQTDGDGWASINYIENMKPDAKIPFIKFEMSGTTNFYFRGQRKGRTTIDGFSVNQLAINHDAAIGCIHAVDETGYYLKVFNSNTQNFENALTALHNETALYQNNTKSLTATLIAQPEQDPINGVLIGDGTGRSGVTLDSSDKKFQLFCEKDGSFGNIHQRNTQNVWEKDFITWRKDAGVEFNYNGSFVCSTIISGIQLPANNGLKATKGVNFSNALNDQYKAFSIQQVSNTGTFEANYISCYQDAGVTIFYGNKPILLTKLDGLFVTSTVEQYTHLLVSNANNTVQLGLKAQSAGDTAFIFTNINNVWTQPIGFTVNTGTLNGTWHGSITPSQRSIKTNITRINGLDQINKLAPIAWNWSEPRFFDDSLETVGFSLESYEQVFPELVDDYNPFSNDQKKERTPDDKKKAAYFKGIKGIKKGITSFKMDAMLVSAIQDLDKKNKELEERILKLEGAKHGH